MTWSVARTIQFQFSARQKRLGHHQLHVADVRPKLADLENGQGNLGSLANHESSSKWSLPAMIDWQMEERCLWPETTEDGRTEENNHTF